MTHKRHRRLKEWEESTTKIWVKTFFCKESSQTHMHFANKIARGMRSRCITRDNDQGKQDRKATMEACLY